MTIEQTASILAVAAKMLTEIGAITLDVDKGDARVHLRESDFANIPGDTAIRERDYDKYPFELSKTIMGVKFFCVVDALPDECKGGDQN